MKKILLTISVYWMMNAVHAQTPAWLSAKAMGGMSMDFGYSIVLDASGNIYSTGRFQATADFNPGVGTFNLVSAGVYDIFISKLDNASNFVWANQIGGPYNDQASSIVTDASGNVYTTGYFNGTVDFDPGAGVFNLTCVSAPTYFDIFISKLDNAGNFIWAKSIGGADFDWGYSLTIDASGNVYSTGYFTGTADFDPGAGVFNLTSAGGVAAYISKLDSAGNFIWAKQMSGNGEAAGTSIAVDVSGNVFSTGFFNGTIDFNPGTGVFNLFTPSSLNVYDIFISKLDSAGNFVWTKQMGGTENDQARSIAIDTSGNGDVYTTGAFGAVADFDPGAGIFNLTSASGWLTDIFISKIDSAGNFVWAKAMGGASSYSETAYSLALDPSGSGDVYSIGNFYGTSDFDPGAGVFNLTSAGAYDIFISKLDAAGNFVWAKGVGGVNDDMGWGIALDAAAFVYATGYFKSPSIVFDATTLINISSIANTADIFIGKLDTISIPTIVTEQRNQLTEILFSPNPTTNEIRIENGKFKVESVEVYDVFGEIVFSQTATAREERINVSSLPPGIYFVKVSGEKEECVAKFVKQ